VFETVHGAPRQPSRANNRLRPLLDAGARAFARYGYSATTVRAIAASASMTPGAIYVHFPSKQALLLAVYEEGVRRAVRAVDAAVASAREPWARLEAAVVAHLETILDGSDYAKVITHVLPDDVPDYAAELRALRDGYEARIADLVRALRLPKRIDRRLFRLMLLSAINWVPVWYRPDSGSVRTVGRAFVAMLRDPCSARPA
jgi:TetR/AcrR family transcriptional regulator, cholesterol catabolism regulator